jgi:hypothetical protein
MVVPLLFRRQVLELKEFRAASLALFRDKAIIARRDDAIALILLFSTHGRE